MALRRRSRPKSNRGRQCFSYTATATTSFRRRRCFTPRMGSPSSTFRLNGTCHRESATASIPKACATAANFWHADFGALFRLDALITAWSAGRWHGRHFIPGRRRRDPHLRVDVAGRMDNAARSTQTLAQVLIALASRLRIELTGCVLVGRRLVWTGGRGLRQRGRGYPQTQRNQRRRCASKSWHRILHAHSFHTKNASAAGAVPGRDLPARPQNFGQNAIIPEGSQSCHLCV